MKDLMPYKNKLMELTYEEKIHMSEWLHTEIDLERAQAVKEKAAKVNDQLNSFLDKAAATTKTTGGSLLNSFRSVFNGKKEGDK